MQTTIDRASAQYKRLRASEGRTSTPPQPSNVDAHTLSAGTLIHGCPLMLEDEVLVLLHALRTRIERNGNMHAEFWHDLVSEHKGHELALQEQIDAAAAWHDEGVAA